MFLKKEGLQPFEKPEITERERKLLEGLEGLPFYGGYHTQSDLILAWRGLKPATEIALRREWFLGEKPIFVGGKDIQKLLDVISALGLHYVDAGRNTREPLIEKDNDGQSYEMSGEDIVRVCVSREKEIAEKLKSTPAFVGGGGSKSYGTLCGYPETAINAFVEAERGGEARLRKSELLIRKEELPADTKNQEFMAFLNFRISRAHWREELEVVKRWSEEIRSIKPTLYEKIVLRWRAMQKPRAI